MKVWVECFSCLGRAEFELPIGRAEECPSCRRDLHVCLNCRFYDKKAYHECTEPQAEYVQDKDRGNFCDLFEPSKQRLDTGARTEAQEALDKLSSLFGDPKSSAAESGKTEGSLADQLAAFLAGKNKG